MADFDLSKITGREPPLVTDDERDAEIAYLSDVVANRDRELAALRARVAELEADAAGFHKVMELLRNTRLGLSEGALAAFIDHTLKRLSDNEGAQRNE